MFHTNTNFTTWMLHIYIQRDSREDLYRHHILKFGNTSSQTQLVPESICWLLWCHSEDDLLDIKCKPGHLFILFILFDDCVKFCHNWSVL